MSDDRVLEIIDWITGYFQFKSETSEIAQKGITLMNELKQLYIKKEKLVLKWVKNELEVLD